jgi:hypothetical protein
MKKFMLLAASVLTLGLTANAQAGYQPVLESTFVAFDTSFADMTAKANAGNKLVLIAKKYADQWSPQYYAAYSRVQLSFMEKDEAKRDAYVDEAENYYADAVRLLGKESDETEVLAAMIAQARMSVNPQQRWQKYGKLFEEHLDKAKELNADNPRIYLQRGISKYFTPKMFGGGKKAAMPYFEKSQALYAKESATNIDQPHWGRTTLNYFLKMANGQEDTQSTK